MASVKSLKLLLVNINLHCQLTSGHSRIKIHFQNSAKLFKFCLDICFGNPLTNIRPSKRPFFNCQPGLFWRVALTSRPPLPSLSKFSPQPKQKITNSWRSAICFKSGTKEGVILWPVGQFPSNLEHLYSVTIFVTRQDKKTNWFWFWTLFILEIHKRSLPKNIFR